MMFLIYDSNNLFVVLFSIVGMLYEPRLSSVTCLLSSDACMEVRPTFANGTCSRVYPLVSLGLGFFWALSLS